MKSRFLEYYNVNRLLNEKSMPISVALLKHGYHNFSVTILEICDIVPDSIISREKQKNTFLNYTLQSIIS